MKEYRKIILIARRINKAIIISFFAVIITFIGREFSNHYRTNHQSKIIEDYHEMVMKARDEASNLRTLLYDCQYKQGMQEER